MHVSKYIHTYMYMYEYINIYLIYIFYILMYVYKEQLFTYVNHLNVSITINKIFYFRFY